LQNVAKAVAKASFPRRNHAASSPGAKLKQAFNPKPAKERGKIVLTV
jgi:hypothetical protein